jgi:hypothetical protein
VIRQSWRLSTSWSAEFQFGTNLVSPPLRAELEFGAPPGGFIVPIRVAGLLPDQAQPLRPTGYAEGPVPAFPLTEFFAHLRGIWPAVPVSSARS